MRHPMEANYAINMTRDKKYNSVMKKIIEIIMFKITAKRSFIIHIQIKSLHIDSQIIVELKKFDTFKEGIKRCYGSDSCWKAVIGINSERQKEILTVTDKLQKLKI